MFLSPDDLGRMISKWEEEHTPLAGLFEGAGGRIHFSMLKVSGHSTFSVTLFAGVALLLLILDDCTATYSEPRELPAPFGGPAESRLVCALEITWLSGDQIVVYESEPS